MSNPIFETIMMNKPKSNTFDLSHDKKLSLNMGDLVPILVQDVVPGDRFRVQSEQLMRMAPMVAPVMHRIEVFTHYFFVPYRILWNEFESFITMGEDGMERPPYPYTTIESLTEGSVGDYMGLPMIDTTGGEPVKVGLLQAAGYARIYNEYYRDQNLIEPIKDEVTSGPQDDNFMKFLLQDKPKKRAWEHDYFTSALPFAQKGQQVNLPLGGSAAIAWGDPNNPGQPAQDDRLRDVNGGQITTGAPNSVIQQNGGIFNAGQQAYIDNSANLYADLSSATAISINELRRANALQTYLEKNARGGSRYIENIVAHFGVRSSDKRLQRPEYLGGGRSNVAISEVLQTSESVGTPQGTMAGHGINVGNTHGFSYFAEEHGCIIGIMSVMPKTSYQQGIPRMYTKFDVLDHYWPDFANIGEQEIKNKEIFIHPEEDIREGTFGYIPRYSEYKYAENTVHGDFKTTLDFWHMGRIFENQPSLNASFIESNPTTRIFAVETNVDHLWCHVYHSIKATRPMPVFGIPTI